MKNFKLSKLLLIAFVAVGSLITFLVYNNQSATHKSYNNLLPYKSLSDNLMNRVTTGHLWVEEYLGGDASINYENDVLKRFISSKVILQGALNFQKTELGKFNDVDDQQISFKIDNTIDQLDILITSANVRNELYKKGTSGSETGGEIDQQFDEYYEKVISSLEDLGKYINLKIERDSKRQEIYTYINLSCIVLIFLAIGFLLYRIQTKSEKLTEENNSKSQTETLRISELTSFVESISVEEYDKTLNINVENDTFAKILLKMRDQLVLNKKKDDEQNWVTTGLAKFSELLRLNNENIEDFSKKLISNLVKYVGANQGGIFVLEKDGNDQFLELKAAYAYDRLKLAYKRIEIGEGLIGECYLEQETIIMSEIPDNYINITSGLGDSNPNNIIIVPLKANKEIYGILELASFKVLEKYEIDFIERLAESIASTLSSVKVTITTQRLLEESQQMSNQLQAQEEELRQNQEEMLATQEEMQRKIQMLEDEISSYTK